MTDVQTPAVIKIYTNDITLEAAKQDKAAKGDHRLASIRNRIARSKSANLVAIALVASERKDKTIATEARARLTDLGVLEKGQPLKDVIEIVESRRPSRSKEFQAVTGTVVEVPTPEATDETLEDSDAS